jgi:hypothetical protein
LEVESEQNRPYSQEGRSNPHEQLQRDFAEHAQATGLIVNCEKTEHLRLNINDTTDLKLGDKTIRQVDDFKYLGSLIASKSNDVSQPIAKG